MSISAPSSFSRMSAPPSLTPTSASPSSVAIGISNTPSSISSSSSVQAPSIFARVWNATVSFFEACWEWITSFFSSACSTCQDTPASQIRSSNSNISNSAVDLLRARAVGTGLIRETMGRVISFLDSETYTTLPAFEAVIVIKTNHGMINHAIFTQNAGEHDPAEGSVPFWLAARINGLMNDSITDQNLQNATELSISTAILVRQPTGNNNIYIANCHHSLVNSSGDSSNNITINLAPAASWATLIALSNDDRFYSALNNHFFPTL